MIHISVKCIEKKLRKFLKSVFSMYEYLYIQQIFVSKNSENFSMTVQEDSTFSFDFD